jgi:tetrapyrrole methylase family protein/MazG family protein
MTEFERLVDIMRKLRKPDGCPWDREQTHETLKPYLIEEAYELLDAIDSGDDHEIILELGDVLLQVVFHAQVASETARFSIEDVARAIAEKLVRRHPHIFGDVSAEDSETVITNWETIKREEKKSKGQEQMGLFDDIPRQLPALMRAQAIQKKAARVGFDWDEIAEVTAKAREEVAEFVEAVDKGAAYEIEEELGDLLFSLVNIARFVDVNPEEALTKTNQKFLSRFAYIERKLAERGSTPAEATLEEMDDLWEEAKKPGNIT